MTSYNQIVYVTVVALMMISAVLCEDDSDVQESRTFGHHFLKRISFALIPTAFVVGMITTLLGALTIVSIKGLGVGIILLILTVGQMIARGLPAAVPYAQTTYAAPAPAPIPVIYKDW